MPVLVDTNVLIFSIQRGHPWQPEAVGALEALLETGEEMCVFLQNMAEFWTVCTRPLDRNGLGIGVTETERRLAELDSILTVVTDSRAVYRAWRELLVRHDVKGVQAHDARLVAGMIVAGIDRIVTYNPNDFTRYDRITALHPSEIRQVGLTHE